MAGREGGRSSLEPSTSIDDDEEAVQEEGSKRRDDAGEEEKSKEEVDDSNCVDEGDEHDQLQQQDETDEPDVKVESQPTEFVSGDVFSAVSRHKQGTLLPYGLPCVRELLRFLVSLINMRERCAIDHTLVQLCHSHSPCWFKCFPQILTFEQVFGIHTIVCFIASVVYNNHKMLVSFP